MADPFKPRQRLERSPVRRKVTGQNSEMEVASQEKLTDQSSYLVPNTNKNRRFRKTKEEEKTLMKKRRVGGRINNNGAMDERSSADEGRSPTSCLRDLKGLMKSLEILTLNMERIMKRISMTTKGDSTLDKHNAENVREIRRVRQWIDANAETNRGHQERRSVAIQMTPK